MLKYYNSEFKIHDFESELIIKWCKVQKDGRYTAPTYATLSPTLLHTSWYAVDRDRTVYGLFHALSLHDTTIQKILIAIFLVDMLYLQRLYQFRYILSALSHLSFEICISASI